MLRSAARLLTGFMLVAGIASAAPFVSYSLTFGGAAVTVFPSPLTGDSMSISATNYFGHLVTPQNLGTTDTATQAQNNFNAGNSQNSTQILNINQNVTIGSLGGGVTLANAATQTLAWTFQDAVTGSSHVFSAAILPSATFLFTDGTALTVTASVVNPVTLSNTSSSFFNNVTYSITYASSVPEPATYALVGGGLALVAMLKRRQAPR